MVTSTHQAIKIPDGSNEKAYREKIWDRIGFCPTDAQRPIMESDARRILVSGGEGSGKSLITAIWGLVRIPKKPKGLGWIVGELFDDAREEFKYTADFLAQMGYLDQCRFPDEGQCTLRAINGFRVVTKAAQDPMKLIREAPDWIEAVEAAKLSYESYLRLRGRIMRTNGDMFMSGSLEGSLSWYVEFLKRWSGPNDENAKSFVMASWTNLHKYPGGREDAEILDAEAHNPLEYFKERYSGEPCPPAGLIMTEFSNQIHVRTEVEYNPELPVEISSDPGYDGACVVHAIQRYPDVIQVIDEVYKRGMVTKAIIDLCRKKWPWFPGAVEYGSVDIYGTQHQAMPPVVDVWFEETRLRLQSKKINENQGIDALRTLLKVHPETGQPGIVFSPRCQGVISEMGGGPSPIFGGGPWLRNENTLLPEKLNNHGCKSLIYYAVNRMGYALTKERREVRVSHFF